MPLELFFFSTELVFILCPFQQYLKGTLEGRFLEVSVLDSSKPNYQSLSPGEQTHTREVAGSEIIDP